ncbi:MAG: AMP-binding protein [Cognaticolwellia aestuarii]
MDDIQFLAANPRLFVTEQQTFSGEDFIAAVSYTRQQIQAAKQQQTESKPLSVLLFESNLFAFAVKLFALANENCQILLPPNAQVATINELSQQADLLCGSDINGTSQLSLSNIDAIKPKVTNHQKIACRWPEQGKLVFFTSGSSGKSKAITKTWLQLNAELNTLIGTFNFTGQHTFFATVPHWHIYGLLFRLLLPLRLSACIEQTYAYPEHAIDLLVKTDNLVLISSPAFLKRLSVDNVFSDYQDKFARIISSGGKLDLHCAFTLYQQLALAVTQVYGSTESGGIAHKQVKQLSEPVWQIFNGINISVNDRQQLVLASPWVEQSALVMDDVIELVNENAFNLLGRADRTIKIEEKRIDLGDIETYLNQHLWVDECRVLVLDGARQQLVVVAALTALGQQMLAKTSKRELNHQLKAYLLTKFEAICLPRKWRYLTELPYNQQGKLPLSTLEQLFD